MKIKPWLVAVSAASALGLWMASGQLPDAAGVAEAGEAVSATPTPKSLFRVQTRNSNAQALIREVELFAKTAPARRVQLKVETAGRVLALPVDEGDSVAAGTVLLKLEQGTLGAELRAAQALLTLRQGEFDNARILHKRGHVSSHELGSRNSALADAKLQLARVRQALADKTLKAPFAGVLESRAVEQGQLLAVGDVIGELVQTRPFLVVAHVSERDVTQLRRDQSARIQLLDGRQLQGSLRYIATTAVPETRSFRVEVAVDDAGEGRVATGASVRLWLPLEEVRAHVVPASLLSLNEAGQLGLKSVGADGRVQFHSAQLLSQRGDDLWLGGLPEQLQLIAVGAGFVRAGDKVSAVAEGAEG